MTRVIHTFEAGRIGPVLFDIIGSSLEDNGATLSLCFHTEIYRLGINFSGTTAEMREFAAELIRHADITDAKQAELDAGAAA